MPEYTWGYTGLREGPNPHHHSVVAEVGPIVPWQGRVGGGGGNRGEGLGSELALVSFGGRLLSSTEIGEGGYHGETYGAE